VIQATSQHPFWDATTHRFTYAADLRPGDKLLEPGGQTVAVLAVRHYRADLTAYNLDVSGIHTYYVQAAPWQCSSTTAADQQIRLISQRQQMSAVKPGGHSSGAGSTNRSRLEWPSHWVATRWKACCVHAASLCQTGAAASIQP
jgi:Pretoxin HINT domain